MTEPTIFPTDQEGTPEGGIIPPSIAPETITPPIPAELADLVGEGKKYASLDAIYKAFPNQVSHITTLEAENARMRAEQENYVAELAKRKTAEELLADIKQSTTTSTTNAPVDASPDIISEAVRNELARQAAEQTANAAKETSKANQLKVVTSFKEQYGEKAEQFYSELASKSSMSIVDLNNLAVSSPDAVLKLAGLTLAPKQSFGSLSSSVNTEAMLNSQPAQSKSGVRLSGNHSSKDLANAWRAARESVNKNLGIT